MNTFVWLRIHQQIQYTDMYKLFSLSFFAFLLLSTTALSAQDVSIAQRDAIMSLGSRPSYTLRFDGIKDSKVEDLWKDFVKDNFDKKAKKNRKTKEFAALGASAKSIHAEEFDLYSKVEGSKTDATLTLWIDLGSNFLNAKDNGQSSEELEGYLRAFNNEVEKWKAAEQVEVEKDALKDLENELNKLKSKNDDLHKEIDNYREKIRKAEQEIKENDSDQDKKRDEINSQEKNLDAAQKALSDLGG